MEEVTDEIKEKLIDIGVNLSNMESLLRIMQVCFDYEENLKKWDIQVVFQALTAKIIETKQEFSSVAVELDI